MNAATADIRGIRNLPDLDPFQLKIIKRISGSLGSWWPMPKLIGSVLRSKDGDPDLVWSGRVQVEYRDYGARHEWRLDEDYPRDPERVQQQSPGRKPWVQPQSKKSAL